MFMGSPWPMVSLFAVYLVFVLKIGPKFMEKRKAYNLDRIIRFYNLFQVIACSWFVYIYHLHGFSFRNTWKCVTYDGSPEKNIAPYWHFWFFLGLRTIELIETVFFVLRKKQNQISALHLYHHLSTIALLWLFFKYSCGELFFTL